MECLKYRKMISEYIDGFLSKSSEENLLSHMSSCEDCNTFYKNHLKLKSYIKDAYSVPLKKVDFTKSIMSTIKNKELVVRNKRSPIHKNFLYAASFFLIMGAAFLIFSNISSDKNDKISSAQKSDKLEELVLEHMDRSNVIAVSGISIADVVYEK